MHIFIVADWLPPSSKILFDPPKDGNCQFEALSHQMLHVLQREISSVDLRCNIVAYLKCNPLCADNLTRLSEFCISKDWNTYLSDMQKQTCWGDNLTLQAFCDKYSVNVLVVSSLGSHATTFIYPTGKSLESNPCLILGHAAECHYLSLDITDKDILQAIKNKVPKVLTGYPEGHLQQSDCTEPCERKNEAMEDVESNFRTVNSQKMSSSENRFVPIVVANQPNVQSEYGEMFSKMIGGRERKFQIGKY